MQLFSARGSLFFFAITLLATAGAGCEFFPTDEPISSYETCVAHGLPSNDALGQCRFHGTIYYKYGQPTTPTATPGPTKW